jgi:hypothetical protein
MPTVTACTARLGLMHAELRGLYSPDTEDLTLEAFLPPDPEHFTLVVGAYVGPSDAGGEELFTFVVCSPSSIAELKLQKGFGFQRDTLLLERWDPQLIQRAIGDLCRRTEGLSWNEVAVKLSRYGRWEFEDADPQSR